MQTKYSTWRGFTLMKMDGTVILEDNFLVEVMEREDGSSMTYLPATHSFQTMIMGPPFAEEIDVTSDRA